MNRQQVESSCLRSVGHQGTTLELEFHSGSVYRYPGVPPEVHRSLLAAPSLGRYFHEHIRDHYPYERLT
ncbi:MULTISPECIES: KTSC domain-containing protein [unclassified Kitasatospora]|uniref:KTSC domain-containing protein n=1 Tax=unclassified Kitasatospora TaxID=2633591 RepID=UPI00070DE475|nr:MULTISPECIES: KTSC domain-containing protein [unclassified Kitasatospora]KQV15387.1 KTSC domain containing protein [Kitasatospora sp. Root107]KRB64024.1 KTSC domain containing protein [Kitasatospora sp. Root187]